MILDIATWLQGIGLTQYAELFRSNDIDGALLRGLNGDDLKELGVASLGHHKIMLEAIAALGDLAQLLAERGERQQAADLFGSIYGAFTEGFDTLDLVESKALLDELRH